MPKLPKLNSSKYGPSPRDLRLRDRRLEPVQAPPNYLSHRANYNFIDELDTCLSFNSSTVITDRVRITGMSWEEEKPVSGSKPRHRSHSKGPRRQRRKLKRLRARTLGRIKKIEQDLLGHWLEPREE